MTNLDELRAHLTDDQRAILNKIWRHLLDHNEGNPWIPSGILYHQLGKGANEQTVHAILQPLGGTVVNEQADHNGGKHYILTALGFLLTEAGAEIEHVLSKYLEYMKRQYIDTDGTVGTIPLQEVATHFGFTEEQSFLLRRSLIVFYDLFGGGSLDAPSLPGCKDELIGKENLRAWLIEREFQKFNPKVPINRNPFLSYGTEETHDEIEQTERHPERETQRFPANITYNYTTHNYGPMSGVQQGGQGNTQNVTITNNPEFGSAISELLRLVESAKAPAKIKEGLTEDIQAIEKLAAKRPTPGLIERAKGKIDALKIAITATDVAIKSKPLIEKMYAHFERWLGQ